jgi:hypothetical protein
MYIAGVLASLEPGSAAQLTTLIAQNKAGFVLARASFGSAFSTYHATAKGIAGAILQVVYFVRRGAPRDLIMSELACRCFNLPREGSQ